MPRAKIPSLLLFFAETGRNQLLQLGQNRLGILTLGDDPEDRSLTGSEHHESHDALAVHSLSILLDPDLGSVAAGCFDKEGCRTSMETVAVLDGQVLGG